MVNWELGDARFRVMPKAAGVFLLAVATPALAQAQATPPAPAAPAAATPSAPAAPTGPAAPSGPAAAPSAPAAPAHQVEYAIDGNRVVAISGSQRIELPMPRPARALRRVGLRLYVAHGSNGVSVYDVSEPLSPQFVRLFPTAGSAADFTVVDDEIWVIVEARSAVPLEETVPLAAPPPGPESPAPKRETPGAPVDSLSTSTYELTKVAPGTAQIAIGSSEGVRVGDRFVIIRPKSVRGSGADEFAGEELIDVAVVVAVKEGSCLVELGRSSVVTPADLARRARAKEDDSIVFPQRVPGVGEAALVLRPLVNVGSPIGVGLLSTLEASYWGGSYFVGVRVDPIGLGVTADGSIVATSALAEGGYDGQAFLVGLGFGVSAVNGNLDYMLDDSGYMYATDDAGYTYEVVDQQETHFAFTLSQVARLGARDGLRLWVRNLLLLHREDGLNTDGTGYEEQSGFIYGGTSAELSIPTGRRADFFVEGGGGLMGYWFAGAGVSTWIYGNGSPGSWRLSVSAGGAGISGSRKVTQTYYDGINPPTETTYDETVSIMGPMVSIGIARRFSF